VLSSDGLGAAEDLVDVRWSRDFSRRSPTVMQAAGTSHLLGALDGLEGFRVFGDSTKMLREDAGQGAPDLCGRRPPQASASCARTCRPSLRSSPRQLDGRIARLRRQHEEGPRKEPRRRRYRPEPRQIQAVAEPSQRVTSSTLDHGTVEGGADSRGRRRHSCASIGSNKTSRPDTAQNQGNHKPSPSQANK
jgi:hypothetical protein